MALSPALLAALRTVPQDPDRFLVLADRLQSEGDVRGELIMLQARRAEAPETVAFAQAEERFLQDHAKPLLGRLWTSPSSYIFHWELGFIRHGLLWAQELDAQQQRLPGRHNGGPQPRRRTGKLTRLTGDLLELESAALLESLTIGLPRSNVQRARMLDAVAQVAALAPPTLRLLQVRDLVQEYDAHRPQEWRLPDYEPGHLRELNWRGRAFTLSSDGVPLDAIAEALDPWGAV